MDQDVDLSFRLSPALLRAARDVALQRDISLGSLLREALVREIRREVRSPTLPDRADEARIDHLRQRFGKAFAEAKSWEELQDRLLATGARLVEAGGGLALVSWPGGQRLCKASDLGASLARLSRRFRSPWPGHAMGSLWAGTPLADRAKSEIGRQAG